MKRKISLNEEISRIKNLMVYNNGDYKNPLLEYELLNEAETDEIKEVPLQAEFGSGKWMERSLPKEAIVAELKDAVNWLKQKTEEIKKSGGIINGQAKILTVQIVAGESLVPNRDGEVNPVPNEYLETGVLATRRADTIKKFLEKYFNGLKNQGVIADTPTFEAAKIEIGTAAWDKNKGKDHPDYKAEQFIKVLIKLSPPTACLEGLSIDVIYDKTPNNKFPCRGGHQCNDAEFDVYLNQTKIGVANLNNDEDGGSRMSSFTVSPQQALAILGNKPGNILISFVCKYTDRRCHSSTPEIRIRRGNSVIYHACTPSLSEDNDYSKIDVMRLDPCGNLIERGQENKAAQKDQDMMKPPAGLQTGWLVYDIKTKLPVFKPASSETDIKENMYKEYLPLYGQQKGAPPDIYKGKCNESKIYGGWCLWSGYKVSYLNNKFCDGAEYGSIYRLGSETQRYPNAGPNITKLMRNYILDNCAGANLEMEKSDIIAVGKDSPITAFNPNRLYAPYHVYSDPQIVGGSNTTPYKIVSVANGKNFTPKEFVDFINILYTDANFTGQATEIANLITAQNIKEVKGVTGGIGCLFFADEKPLTPYFPNYKKIDSYVAKYDTYKGTKLSGRVILGMLTGKAGDWSTMSVQRVYENGKPVNVRIYVVFGNSKIYSKIAQKLKDLGKIKLEDNKWVVS